jgi:hypothetical protein
VLFSKFPGKPAKSRGLCANARHPYPPAGSRCVELPGAADATSCFCRFEPTRRIPWRPLATPRHSPSFLSSSLALPLSLSRGNTRRDRARRTAVASPRRSAPPRAPPRCPAGPPRPPLLFPSKNRAGAPRVAATASVFPAGDRRRRRRFSHRRCSSGRTATVGDLLVSQGSARTPPSSFSSRRSAASELPCGSPAMAGLLWPSWPGWPILWARGPLVIGLGQKTLGGRRFPAACFNFRK